jgi:Ca2+-binding RTX toxin-like protein
MVQFALIGLLILIIVGVISALAATNTVPTTRADSVSQAINANALKPIECAALNLTSVVLCPGGGANCDGTGANELILGSLSAERIRGRGGTDCILGGDGNDNIIGNAGGDVCIGGPGTDTFATCETAIQ